MCFADNLIFVWKENIAEFLVFSGSLAENQELKIIQNYKCILFISFFIKIIHLWELAFEGDKPLQKIRLLGNDSKFFFMKTITKNFSKFKPL